MAVHNYKKPKQSFKLSFYTLLMGAIVSYIVYFFVGISSASTCMTAFAFIAMAIHTHENSELAKSAKLTYLTELTRYNDDELIDALQSSFTTKDSIPLINKFLITNRNRNDLAR